MKTTALLVMAMIIGAVSPAGADGMLDPSFGKGGLVTTAFPGSFSQDVAFSLIVMPDGRAVAAGSTNINLIETDMAVARYLFSGALDTTFGGDGRVTIPFPQQGGSISTAEAVLLQADGRLVLVGWTAGDFFGSFALARLNPDGSLDSSFGTGGLVTAPADASAGAGLLQPDGRIVAAGATGTSSMMVARYNPDGSLDPTFGGDGTVTVTAPGSFDVQAVVLQPDGRLVIAGTSPLSFSQVRNFALVRLLPDGTLDTSFGGDGIVSSDFGAIETGFSVILLPDGRLVVAGARTLMSTPNSPVDIALARYLPDGSVDTTFGTGGLVLASMSPVEWATQLIRLPDGKLLTAGSIFRKKGDFLLARFFPDGVLDTSFGVHGFLRTNFNAGSDECNAAALAGPDLVLTVGTTTPAGQFDPDYALARYIVTTGHEVTSGVE